MGLKKHLDDIIRLALIILVSDYAQRLWPDWDSEWKIVLSRALTVLLTAALIVVLSDRVVGRPTLTVNWLEDRLAIAGPELLFRHGNAPIRRPFKIEFSYRAESLLGWWLTRRLDSYGSTLSLGMKPQGILRTTTEWHPEGARLETSRDGLRLRLTDSLSAGQFMTTSISLQPTASGAHGTVSLSTKMESPRLHPQLSKRLIRIDTNVNRIKVVGDA